MPDAELHLDRSTDQVAVSAASGGAPLLVQNVPVDRRAFIHPILIPGGTEFVTEDAPAHHPWQHGLYVGLNDVNGAGFWHEGMHPRLSEDDGTFHPRLLDAALADSTTARWSVSSEYRDKTGVALLTETQEWSFRDQGDRYELDLALTFHAETELTFGRYDYGGLFIRMPYRPEIGGRAFTSEGLEGDAAEGTRARWAAVQMPIDGADDEVLVAIMDHPGNREHPVPWRVDHELGIVPSVSIAGPWHLESGAEETFHYRVLIAAHPLDAAEIDASWHRFSQQGDQ